MVLNNRFLFPFGFFIFIIYIIFLADTANYNFAFRLVGHIPYGDKMCHALLYGIMAFLLNYGLNFKQVKHFGSSLQLGSILVFVFAGIEELTQYYIPSRTFDLNDLLADFIGVVLFSLWRIKK